MYRGQPDAQLLRTLRGFWFSSMSWLLWPALPERHLQGLQTFDLPPTDVRQTKTEARRQENSCVHASRQLASHNSLHARKQQLAVLSALAAGCRVLFGNDWRRTTQRSGEQKRTHSQPPPPPASCSPSISLPRPPHTHHPAHALAASPRATAPPIRQKAQREHRRKCGGRTRQPRGPLTRCL